MSFWGALTAATWLGLLTSVSPCPLATNVVAISFLSKNVGSPWRAVAAGLSYACGRMLSYGILAAIIVTGLLSTSSLSLGLQHYLSKVIGPVLVVSGMMLLDLIPVRLPSIGHESHLRVLAGKGTLLGALLLGAILALAFCPVSAALFFGSLIPLAVADNSPFALPFVYGLATSAPVLVLGIGLSLGAHWAAKSYDRLLRIERAARKLTGIVFVAVGAYLSLKYVFHLL